MKLLFTDFSLLITILFRKHSIYPLFAVFYYYGYIYSHFLKSLLSDVLSLLFRCTQIDCSYNFSLYPIFKINYIFYLDFFYSFYSILFTLKISSLSLHRHYYYNDILQQFIIVIKKLAYCYNIITINLLFLLIVMIPYFLFLTSYFLLVASIELATTVSIVPTTFITVTISITFSSLSLIFPRK